MFNKSIFAKFLVLLIVFFASFRVLSFGPPTWADPYVKTYSPEDNKLASKEDKWIAIYSEVEFSVSPEGYLIKTKRSLLENISTKDETFQGMIAYDPSQEEIKEVELKIQSKYRWKKIKINEYSGQINDSHRGSIIFVGNESIPPRNKVAWEYSTIDKTELESWNYEYIFDMFPTLEKKIFISNEAKHFGYTLEIIDNLSSEPLDNFSKISDSSYLVKNIPSIANVPFAQIFPFCMDCVYPYFIFSKGEPEKEIVTFADSYIKKWKSSMTEDSEKAINELALSLTQSKPTLKEKVETITDYVQFNIGYDSSFEKGQFSLIPLPPLEVIRAKRSDCKGKVLLAQQLLNSIGVKSKIILLRYLSIYCPNTIKEITRAKFNHIVLAVDYNSFKPSNAELIDGPGRGLILYDPTSKTTRFGESPPGLEGMTAFMPDEPSKGFFVIRLKKPSSWDCQAKVEIDYDNEKNMNVKIHLIDNGLSKFPSLLKGNGKEKEDKEELTKLLSTHSLPIKIKKVEIKEPPSVGVWEASIEMKVEKPYFELQKSTLYMNPLALLLSGVSLFPDEEKDDFEKKEFTLFAPWNRKLNANACNIYLSADFSIKFTNSPFFILPDSFNIQKEWVNVSVTWSKVEGNSYKSTVRISLPRGKWETEKLEEKINDFEKIKANLNLPVKGI